MAIESVNGIGGSAALLGGLQRHKARFGRAAERIASGEGDLTSNAMELKQAEHGARVTIAALGKVHDIERSALDLLL